MRALSKGVKAAICAGVLLSVFATGAVAHSGHIGHLHESLFTAGFMHPLTGLDHLLAMIAVGLWSALSHGSLRQAVLAPAVFLIMLFVGAMLGILGLQVPVVEPMIMASLLILGLLVASRRVVNDAIGFAVVGLFAVFHGLAHGMELPAGDGVIAFVAGFMLATLVLHMIGLFAGFQLKRCSAWFSRVLGAGVAAYGLLLVIGI
jgi:urease accessory protein